MYVGVGMGVGVVVVLVLVAAVCMARLTWSIAAGARLVGWRWLCGIVTDGGNGRRCICSGILA